MRKRDPAKEPIVRKRHRGPVLACTTDIAAFCGRSRHDHFLAAVDKVIAKDPKFGAKNFFLDTYVAKNGQTCRCFRMTREGFARMCSKMHGMHDYKVLYLDAYDLCEYENRRRMEKAAEPPDLDPAIIVDDPAALEPVDPRIILDLRKEPGGPEEHARRIIEVSGSTETPELMAKILHALPPALEEPELPPLDDPVVHVDGMRVYATTLDIAAFFHKQHKHILANAREIEALQPDFYGSNFRLVSYKGRNGEDRPAYEVTRAGFALVVSGFTGAKALEFRVRYIEQFDRMEAALQAQAAPAPAHPDLPLDYLSALRQLVGATEQVQLLEQQKTVLSNENAVLVHKTETLSAKVDEQDQFLDAYRRLANAEGLSLVSNIAKVLHIPQGEMFDRLHKSGYIFRRKAHDTSSPWLAYDKWVKKGLFDHKIWQQPMDDGTKKDRPQLYATRKGVEVISMLFGKDDSGQGRLSLGMH